MGDDFQYTAAAINFYSMDKLIKLVLKRFSFKLYTPTFFVLIFLILLSLIINNYFMF